MTQHSLVISEKPSVAQSIAKVLGADVKKNGYLEGNGYLVSWCVGHLVELSDPSVYDSRYAKWRREDLPIFPDQWRYSVSPNTRKQFQVLKQLMARADVSEVVNACDAGREGELIFRLVYNQAGCRKPVKRLWVSSMEDSAIRNGFANLKPSAAYDGLYDAALCRSRADWLVGINATRFFSLTFGPTLNVGRVMTPTLALVTRRQTEILSFRSEPFYVPVLDADGVKAESERQTDREKAERIRAICGGRDATVRAVDKQQRTTPPPKLYDLTTLQRDANRILGYTAQQTLDYLQSLYEKKLCTYPRTESRYLTDDMSKSTSTLIAWLREYFPFGAGLAGKPNLARVTDNSRVTDHHAIIPTMEVSKADLDALPATERELLTLVAVQLLCAVSQPHEYEAVTVTLDCAGVSFTAKGRTVLQGGWKAVEQRYLSDRTEEDPEDPVLPDLYEGQRLKVVASIREGKTTPPKHYTEDKLLGAMETAGAKDAPDDAERKGLGTPATRAATIEKLVSCRFLTRKGKQLLPTDLGMNLIHVLPETLTSPKLTAEWEQRLKQVERRELPPSSFLGGIQDLLRQILTYYRPSDSDLALFPPQFEPVGKCPRCGGTVVEMGKGFFCNREGCRFAMWKNSRFFTAKKKPFTKKIASELLATGRCHLSGCYSERTGKTYDVDVLLDDTGEYVNFELAFPTGKTTRENAIQ